MKITVDIPEAVLAEAMASTGARTRREAIVAALVEFNRRRRRESLAALLGTLDGFPTADEVRQSRRQD